jgi:hypothetical protein
MRDQVTFGLGVEEIGQLEIPPLIRKVYPYELVPAPKFSRTSNQFSSVQGHVSLS